jgi:hypothetical protein
MDVAVFLEPALVLLMGVEIVDDDVKLAIREGGNDAVHEAEETRAGSARHAEHQRRLMPWPAADPSIGHSPEAAARAWHDHKVHHAKHATPNQVKHAKKISKKSLTSASTKIHAKTAAAVAPVRN